MTLKTALAQGTKLLEDGGIEAPRLTAEVLLAHAITKDRVYLIAHASDELSERGWIHYGRYLHQRLKRIPTQYITRKQEFYGREFRVEPGVLIPRPETELLVETVLAHNAMRNEGKVLDIGTGSGCIAMTIAKESKAEVHASEISASAIAIAKRNGVANLVQCNLGEAYKDHSFDVIIANPPYIPESEKLQPEVADNEPGQALFAGPDGLDVIRALEIEARRLLKPNGLLAFEFGGNHQTTEIRNLLTGWQNVRIEKDLAGIDRIALAIFPHPAQKPIPTTTDANPR